MPSTGLPEGDWPRIVRIVFAEFLNRWPTCWCGHRAVAYYHTAGTNYRCAKHAGATMQRLANADFDEALALAKRNGLMVEHVPPVSMGPPSDPDPGRDFYYFPQDRPKAES